jgi:hypothetical protein
LLQVPVKNSSPEIEQESEKEEYDDNRTVGSKIKAPRIFAGQARGKKSRGRGGKLGK